MTDATLPPDHAARVAIVAERARNVAVVAGAGTGKTKTIIDRAVALLAPASADEQPMSIRRIALITFTRRAAGELRFRIREKLLRELEQEARHAGRRAALLRDALANLDAAFVGTIHGFADRLLRLRPVEATLSPAYALIDDNSELVRETFLRLRRATDAGTLEVELGAFAGDIEPRLIRDASETLRAAARSGLQMERVETVFGAIGSVEAILARMIETRDVDIDLPSVPDPQLNESRFAADKLSDLVHNMRGQGLGHRRLRRLVGTLDRLQRADNATEALRIVQEALAGRKLYKSHDFHNDSFGFGLYKEIEQTRPQAGSLGDKLRGPHRWLATQLVRLFPVVRAMYERVKGEHEVVDYLDLLIKLRDLLRDDLDARRFYQGLFDHVFVDEFQDTDPLQCEIIFFLCEDASEQPAGTWDTVRLAPGKLTIVGDPKQSIYRFRRADIVMYDRAMQRLQANGALEQRLETNFRSRPQLITFFNAQLAKLLGTGDGPPFDAATGRVSYEALCATHIEAAGAATVHVLPYADGAGGALKQREGRDVEAMMLARYVRWLLDSKRLVRDPDTELERPVQPGDIAVLACVTTNLRLLLRQFDALGIEYAARGGALFLGHPIVRQYLLALRAIADRDDGVAQAALLRPPFFALDLADAVADRARDAPIDARRARMKEAQAIITDLRQRRHVLSPGAVARDLIERTALARSVVTSDNGQQTVAALYDIAAELDRRAAIDRLDFDAVTELVRSWAEVPVFLDTPEPIHARAVRVMTIHGAKGLEFPVVILWDGFQTFSDARVSRLWEVERNGNAWAVGLGAVAVEHPPGAHLLDREKQFAEQERRRMYYVAATRARDLLVLPMPHAMSDKLRYATTELAAGVDNDLVEKFEVFSAEQLPQWSRFESSPSASCIVGDDTLQKAVDAARRSFEEALSSAAQPIARPTAVTHETAGRAVVEETTVEAERAAKVESSRFGVVFGTTVHRALELVLSAAVTDVESAVAVAAQEAGLTERLVEAVADVERGVVALRGIGVGSERTLEVQTEYPLAIAWKDGMLLSGYIDLLLLGPETVTVIDFKTDMPIGGTLATAYPRYAAQLELYGEMLRRAGVIGQRRLRTAVLLTATGELRWGADDDFRTARASPHDPLTGQLTLLD